MKSVSLDQYSIFAQLFPAAIAGIPLYILVYYLIPNEQVRELVAFVGDVQIVGTLTLSTILLYPLAQIVRFFGKRIEELHFTKKHGLPSTYLMMYANSTFSNAFKNDFRRCVKERLGIRLPTRTQEAKDPLEAKKRMDEAIAQIVAIVRHKGLLPHHNLWYGFVRNFSGGLVVSIAFCLLNLAVAHFFEVDTHLSTVSITLLFLYGVLFALHKPILIRFSEDYARQLFAEFLRKE